MGNKASDVLIDILIDWDVDTIFGLPGDGINGIMEALATPGPVVVEAVVDPFDPPMPPKISVEQAAKFAESVAKGTPNRGRIAWTVLSDKVRELF